MRKLAVALATLALGAAGCATRQAAPDVHRPVSASAATARSAPPARPAVPGGAVAALDRALPPPQTASPSPSTTPADYRVAARDQLAVQVYGHDDLTRTVRVSEQGTITLPLLGELPVAGLTIHEIEAKIEAGLKPAYLRDPRVTVGVSEFQGRQIAVVGAVNQPGAYAFRTNQVPLLQALSEARGVRENADRLAYVLRATPKAGEPQPLEVDLDALFRSGRGGTILLEAGDSVYVPEANAYYVSGEVEKRGAYTLRRDTTVSKALVEAGGVTRRAAESRITVVRRNGNGELQEIADLDLDAIMKGDPKHDLPLQAQDVVVVPAHGGKVVGYGVLDFLRGLFSVGIPLIP
jgi:polysaccharide export outer membrane protein